MACSTWLVRAKVLAIVACVALASCEGNGSNAGNSNPNLAGALPPTSSITPVSLQKIYVANFFGDVTIFPADGSGDIAPVDQVGADFSPQSAIAVDSKGNVYIGSTQGQVVLTPAFPSGEPFSDFPDCCPPNGIAVDHEGNIYASGDVFQTTPFINNVVEVMPAGQPLSVTRNITQDLTNAQGVVVDAEDRIYVANGSSGPCGANGAVIVFAGGASPNTSDAPVGFISGPNTGLNGPGALAIDARGNLYVVVGGGKQLLVFPPGARGNVAPIAKINIPASSATGVALDTAGEIFMSTLIGSGLNVVGAISVYPPLAKLSPSGDTTPIRTISGTNTMLAIPDAIAVH
jgi:hypothetical protein